MPAFVAFAAHDIRAQRDAISHAQGFSVEVEARTFAVVDASDDANNFVSRDDWERRVGFSVGAGVLLRLAAPSMFVRAADAAHLDFEEHRAVFQLRKGKFLNLDLSRMHHYGGAYTVAHVVSFNRTLSFGCGARCPAYGDRK